MQLTPYLNFDGMCREAFTFYAEALHGKIAVMMTNADSPVADRMPPGGGDRIMHVRLETAGAVLMGSDVPAGGDTKAGGMWVSIGVDDPLEAERIYAALSEGATIAMPLQQTFWAKRFGMLTDRFGTPWLINCD